MLYLEVLSLLALLVQKYKYGRVRAEEQVDARVQGDPHESL